MVYTNGTTTSPPPTTTTMMTFQELEEGIYERTTAVCIGTGRFLRAVLAPTLVELGGEIVLAQTRGTSFGTYMESRKPARTYEYDTVLQDGKVIHAEVPVAACGTLGSDEGRRCFMELPKKLPKLRFIGIGLTEAGITHNGQSITDLAEFLYECFRADKGQEFPLSLINTDNLPFNGSAIKNHVFSCDFTQNVGRSLDFQSWLETRVVFHNTMVDRITSHRPGCTDIPRAEPLPAKALVIEDIESALPAQWGSVPGVVLRTQPKMLELDIAMKLRVANGLHTAMVYAMALCGLFHTDKCIGHPDILPYLEQLFERDIVHSCAELDLPRLQATPVFSEWIARLQHPHFGLGCFFVCQNAFQKLGIRLLPSIKATLAAGESPSPFMVFAVAALLRFLTPIGEQPRIAEHPPIFRGHLDGCILASRREGFEYAPGLSVKPADGYYEFCDGDGLVPLLLRSITTPTSSRAATKSMVLEVLSQLEGFEPRAKPAHLQFVEAVASQLHRMVAGEGALDVLASLKPQQPLWLEERQLEGAIHQEVDAAEAADVHTHLFSVGHGEKLMKYGIDEMLTYHYLVSQFLSGSTMDADEFYQLETREQANLVWKALFVDSSPLSEPCRGVLTTLQALGLQEEVAARDLDAIRRWYSGQKPDMFNEKMMRLARLRYVVTTHDPFEADQLESCLAPPVVAPRYHCALALDKLIEGDWKAVREALTKAKEDCTLRGALQLLQHCVEKLLPFFLTVATPHDFQYEPTHVDDAERIRDLPLTEENASVLTHSVVIDLVVLPLCKATNLALSLRMGTCRGICPALRLGGDGFGPAQLKALGTLCLSEPEVKFLATVLRRADQHELAVLSSKFRNLHIWGCWWYCNNPSVVTEVTNLRMELLGTNFTFQASSARVHDQLIYKWIHARSLLKKALAAKYSELLATGWRVSRGDIRRDVGQLLGGAFEEFLGLPLQHTL
mmetsp:Transcript_24501/g.53298  ORF Transcript_24501/g.53298 Transcript_24501/m.53298 type:complete len:958 (+) Transcript_24501:107-2980(+)|eukprot:CAMPEP_0206434086 /NCGR_PEP_ID=MMETSP0324_2-20121206/8935_1 /ASSEMBLY_ACC=CAM_ASM_000836 /TAXON_ID=2866 /ORGANISM="Crypthecodinium cohnii, Strain Seligo" /LENGTH=957 /DNA_ID=CAMNT_0053900507 /DNA_START=77 /DNA_END=2950 /DNA_ORIENTATION=+